MWKVAEFAKIVGVGHSVPNSLLNLSTIHYREEV